MPPLRLIGIQRAGACPLPNPETAELNAFIGNRTFNQTYERVRLYKQTARASG